MTGQEYHVAWILSFQNRICEGNFSSPAHAYNILCTSPFFAGGGWISNQIFRKGSLTRPQLLERRCWEIGGDFFQGSCNFYIKKKKLKYLMTKKFINKNIFLNHN